MTTTVVNKRTSTYDVYIGRGSKWGNPFSHKDFPHTTKVATREQAISRYAEYVQRNDELMNSLHELKGKRLACYCKPLSCHGDVLAALADKI